jgi:hypothetical protein
MTFQNICEVFFGILYINENEEVLVSLILLCVPGINWNV